VRRASFPSIGPRRRPRRRLVLGGLVLLAIAVLLVFVLRGGKPAPHRRAPAERVLVLTPPGLHASPSGPARSAPVSAPAAPGPALAPLPPPSGRRILPVPVGARQDFVSPSLSLPPPPSGWYLEVGRSADFTRAHDLLERFARARFRGWISPRATAAGSEVYRVWIGPYRTRAEVETMMLRATALSGTAPEIVRHRRDD